MVGIKGLGIVDILGVKLPLGSYEAMMVAATPCNQSYIGDIIMAILNALKSVIVFNVDGSVDLEATTFSLQNLLMKEIEETAVRDEEINFALHTVYTHLNVDVFTTPAVVAMASAILAGDNLTSIPSVSEEVKDYLSRSTEFKGERGRNGGLRRLVKR